MARMIAPFVIVVCLVCAPFFLLPSFIAFKNRKRWRGVILAANLLMFVGAIFAAPGAAAALVTWLLLLHLSLRKDVPGDEVLDEDVTLVPHDPARAEQFDAERSRLARTFALPADSIEHIGSTAVPGLVAKPVVDVMLGVAALPPHRDLLSRLEILGYENLGEAGVPGRVYLRLRGERNYNLHIVGRGGEHWTNNLALRDHLRRDAAARARYGAAKQAALAAGGARLLGYSAAKHSAVAELLSTARKP
jgi:GrpB-like predicted nucleotidyltransferase (UPF0157 family)